MMRVVGQKISRGPLLFKDFRRREKERRVEKATLAFRTKVLPNFESVRGEPWVAELVRGGLSSSVRGTLWKAAVGNAAGVTPQMFEVGRLGVILILFVHLFRAIALIFMWLFGIYFVL
jgi:hypothetical protein